MDYKLLLSLGINLAGWFVMIGVYKQKIKQHDEQIAQLQDQLNATNNAFDSIKKGLTDLNTKMDLLLKGQIVNPWEKDNK